MIFYYFVVCWCFCVERKYCRQKGEEQALNKLETMKEASILFSGCSNGEVVSVVKLVVSAMQTAEKEMVKNEVPLQIR